jgi:hypothetical protein
MYWPIDITSKVAPVVFIEVLVVLVLVLPFQSRCETSAMLLVALVSTMTAKPSG